MTRGRSLSLRLLAFAGVSIAAALLAAWLALGFLFERHAERQLQAELERHGLSLIAALSLDPQGRPVLSGRPFDPRFDRPASGLYWRIEAENGEIRSRSLWDDDLPAASTPPGRGWGKADAAGPYEDRVLTVVRDIRLNGFSPPVVIEVAADRAPLAEARSAFSRETAIFLTALWLALAIAAWVQVRLGLAPLARVRRDLDAMRADSTARMTDAAHPSEIRPLTKAIDAYADGHQEDVLRARRRARDLAHALKTPLTALRLQIESLDPATAREMNRSLSLVTGAVEGELARTGDAVSLSESRPAAVVRRLIEVISRTPDGARLSFDLDLPDDLAVPLSEDAALEAFGALIENAARHANSRVAVSGESTATQRALIISDDGPGIPEDQRSAVLERGVRLDERDATHGLGLSIAGDFVHASGGELTLSESALGGLQITLTWPTA